MGETGNIVAYLSDNDNVPIVFGQGRNRPENLVDAAIALTNDGTTDVVDPNGYIRDVASSGGSSDELAKLAGLHDGGKLTDEEYAAAKAKVLAG